MRWICLVPLGLLACSEYEIYDNADVGGRYNPPDLAAEKQVDRIVQVTIPSVDVLWVIDNSCSMEEEQVALTSNFSSFMGYFTGSGLDYHVGVVSTDMDSGSHSGKLREDMGARYIDTTFNQSDAIASFNRRAHMGTSGSWNERGRDAVWAALVQHGSSINSGFYRDDAALSIVAISDEDDQSISVNVYEFISWLQGMKPEADMVSFSSIVGPQGGCSTAAEGTEYLQVTRAVGGIEWSICDGNWSQVLTELGLQAAGLKREFFLSAVPVEDSISVQVIDVDGIVTADGDEDYTYSRSRNSIVFSSFVPDPLSEVLISYEVLASVAPGYEDEEADTGE